MSRKSTTPGNINTNKVNILLTCSVNYIPIFDTMVLGSNDQEIIIKKNFYNIVDVMVPGYSG